MEARVLQFQQDAARGNPKQIPKLRTFLHKNQSYRFTPAEQEALFQAVGGYVSAVDSGKAPELLEDVLLLLEDALKMPFTVFTTSHKKAMLKWLDRLQARQQAAEAGSMPTAGVTTSTEYTLIDLREEEAELMNTAGDTRVVPLVRAQQDLLSRMRQGFDGDVAVTVRLSPSGEVVEVTTE